MEHNVATRFRETRTNRAIRVNPRRHVRHSIEEIDRKIDVAATLSSPGALRNYAVANGLLALIIVAFGIGHLFSVIAPHSDMSRAEDILLAVAVIVSGLIFAFLCAVSLAAKRRSQR